MGRHSVTCRVTVGVRVNLATGEVGERAEVCVMHHPFAGVRHWRPGDKVGAAKGAAAVS